MYERTDICPVILVYGDKRAHLERIVPALMEQGIQNFVFVCNAVTADTLEFLENQRTICPSLVIIENPENTGSASGYGMGISRAAEEALAPLIWLLDDDNLPLADCSSCMVDIYETLSHQYSTSQLVLAANRENFPSPEPRDDPIKFKHRNAAFLGFHLGNLLSQIFRRLQRPSAGYSPARILESSYYPISSAPYGGLMFHRDLVGCYGTPDPDLFLYADDTEFTLRISRHGGALFYAPRCVVVDLSRPGLSASVTRSHLMRRVLSENDERIYYEVRNRVYVSRKYFPGFRILYWINKATYIGVFGIAAVFTLRLKRLAVFLKAIRDGENARLGRRRFP